MTKLDHLKHFFVSAFLSLAPIALLMMTDSKWAHLAWVAPAAAVIRWAYRALGGTGVTAVVVWLAWALTISLMSCAHSSPPVATFGHCTTVALETAAQSILGRVTTALSTGDYADQLAALATEVGSAEVGCAVDLVIAEFTGKATASTDPQVALILQHAQAWRLANP